MSRPGLVVWIGRAISALVAAVFVLSAVMKLVGGPQVEEGLGHLGLPATLVRPLAFLELACAALYLFPRTALLGAILLTGYLGGAILAHLRVGDPFVTQIALGVLLWLGLWLRERRLKALLPLLLP